MKITGYISNGLAVIALSLSAVSCAGLNDVRDQIGLAVGPDVSVACEGIEEPDVLASGDRVACETYAAILQYEGLAVAAETLQEEALASDDRALKQFAAKVGQADAIASPAAQLTNRALDKFLYLDAKTKVITGSEDKVLAGLSAASDAYIELKQAWRDAEPIIAELKDAWGSHPPSGEDTGEDQ